MDALILSEVHVEIPHASAGSALTCTRFSFPLTGSGSESGGEDEDGDVAVRRLQRAHYNIHHQLATTLQHVGQQVWNGGCFFADLFLHEPGLVTDKVVLDLGGGVGLASIAAAHTAKAVFCTDVDLPALELALVNAHANGHHYQHGPNIIQARYLDMFDQSTWPAPMQQTATGTQRIGAGQMTIDAREAASNAPNQTSNPPTTHTEQPTDPAQSASHVSDPPPSAVAAASADKTQIPDRFCWSPNDFCTLQDLDLIFAADLVYDDDLTEAFVNNTVAFLAKCAEGGRCPTLLVGVEKRFNFTIRDMEVKAPAYDHFVACLKQQLASCEARGFHCSVQRLDAASIPQAIAEYDRSGDMELWRVQLQRA